MVQMRDLEATQERLESFRVTNVGRYENLYPFGGKELENSNQMTDDDRVKGLWGHRVTFFGAEWEKEERKQKVPHVNTNSGLHCSILWEN